MAILFAEDWEGSTSGIITNWSDTNDPTHWPTTSNPSVSTTRAWLGTHSLKYHYAGHQSAHVGLCPCTSFPVFGGVFGARYFTQQDEIWLTWFEYMESGFTVDCIGTKSWGIYSQDSINQNLWFVYENGGRSLFLDLQLWGNLMGGTTLRFHNVSSFSHPDNKWICYEAHLKWNTPGSSNGLYELYTTNMTDGGATILRARYINQQWRGPLPTSLVPSTTQFARLKAYVQDGMGDLYRDNITVSTTQVGTGSAPPLDTTPPAAPTGLQVF